MVKLLEENAGQRRVIAELREEIAHLKGLKGRPRLKPSGMEKAIEAESGRKRARRRGRGKVVPRVAVEAEILRVTPPAGSRWYAPAGEALIAPLPGGVRGHFGPELRRFVLMQHHQGQVAVERLRGDASLDRRSGRLSQRHAAEA
ncbi:MAG: hypothetical protein ACREFZ_06265 [Acetobacteraceae bacterium]